MHRRDLLSGALSAAVLFGLGPGCGSRTTAIIHPTEEETRAAVADFPFPRVETTGRNALATWAELKIARRGTPIVLGSDENVFHLMEPFGPFWHDKRAVGEIMEAASRIRHPEDWTAKKNADEQKAREDLKRSLAQEPDRPLPTIIQIDKSGNRYVLSREETITSLFAEHAPELGEWPLQASPSPGLSVAVDISSGNPLSRVHIALIPTDDWTTIPAHLRWGGWNENPDPEFHIAALRSWRDRYGAELVGLGFDTLNLRVSRRPIERDEAIALAREQYVYCADIIDQGVMTYSQLAADLMADDWWYFWWD